MAVLHYLDPADNQWKPLGLIGPQGPVGPPGPDGPQGIQGPEGPLNVGAPLGTIVPYAGSTAPEGWHLCDGSAHGSAPLEELIGSPNTPDLRGKFLLAASDGHPAKEVGGAETHTLNAAEMPSHAHGGITAAMNRSNPHGHGGSGYAQHIDPGGTFTALTTNGLNSGWGVGNADINHEHGVYPDGGDGAHNNMPPYYAVVYIIKKFSDAAAPNGYTKPEADAQFVTTTGATMTGRLNLVRQPVDIHQDTGVAAGSRYFVWGGGVLIQHFKGTDSGADQVNVLYSKPDSNFIRLGTAEPAQTEQQIQLIGSPIRLMKKDTTPFVPTAADHATTKAYVDSRIWFGTQAQYNALGTKDPQILYCVKG